MANKNFDVVVIGGGPAGYPAAIRAAQLGLNVACVDEWTTPDGGRPFGGTCLNVGCIPSQALLESSALYHRAQSEFALHGISVGSLAVDVGKMLERKRQIVKQLTSGIEALFKSAGVTPFKGHGRLLEGNRVEVEGADGKQVLEAKHVVIATGSAPVELPVAKFDGERIVDSSGALEFGEVPKRLGVIGAGVIGLELGSVWRRLGSEVVLLEALDTFLYMADQQVAAEALKHFRRQGLDVRLGAKVTGTERTKNGVKVRYEQGGSTGEIEVDKLIVSVG